MATLDIFNSDAFSLQSMTAAINEIPEVPTVVGSLGVFEEEGVSTTSISIEKQSESLTLVERSARGGVGEQVGDQLRSSGDELGRDEVVSGSDMVVVLRADGALGDVAVLFALGLRGAGMDRRGMTQYYPIPPWQAISSFKILLRTPTQ